MLETLSRLQLEVAAQEPILYEYYATTERPVFQQRFGDNDSAIQRDLDSLSRVLGETGSLASVRAQYARLRELAGALDGTLRVYGTKCGGLGSRPRSAGGRVEGGPQRSTGS